MDFAEQYRQLLWELLDPTYSVEETNERTGHRVRVLRSGQSLSVDLRRGHLPVPEVRKVHPRTAAAEVAWFVRGERDVTWLSRYAKIWAKFVEADGRTVDAAYGHRWKHHFGRDQLWLACKALFEDPSDRRVYVSTWDPASDGLGAKGQKNVPCPVGFTLSVLDGRLNSTLLIRSSDVFVGLPYDVMGHAMLMEVLATTIGPTRVKGLGFMQVSLAHPHVYDSHYDMAREALRQESAGVRMPLKSATLSEVESDPDAFVLAYGEEAKRHKWPAFNPIPRAHSLMGQLPEYFARKAKEWRMRHPDRDKAARAAHKLNHPEAYIFSRARSRAKLKGIKFTITQRWVREQLESQCNECAATRLPLSFNMGTARKPNPWSPSIDRRDGALGYTPENCRIVSWIYNCAKGPWPEQELIKLANALLDQVYR